MHHDCETFSRREAFIFTPVSLDLNLYALFLGLIAVYLWPVRCQLESGGGGKQLWCAFRWLDGKRGCRPRGQSTSVLLKLASLLIYLCLNWTKKPNTVALRTKKKWHASLFWQESWIKYEFLREKKGYIYVRWGWFMGKFWSYNVHVDLFYFEKMWPRQMLSLCTSSQSWEVLKALLCKGPFQEVYVEYWK